MPRGVVAGQAPADDQFGRVWLSRGEDSPAEPVVAHEGCGHGSDVEVLIGIRVAAFAFHEAAVAAAEDPRAATFSATRDWKHV